MTFDPRAQDLTDLGTLKAFLGIPAGRILGIAVTPNTGVYSAAPAISLTGTGQGFEGVGALDGAGHLVGVTVKKQGFGWDPASTAVVIDSALLTSGTPAAALPNVEKLNATADDPLSRVISSASSQAIEYADLYVYPDAGSAQATELYDGNGRDEIPLNRWPVFAIAEVKIDGETIDASAPDGSGVLQPGWIWDPKRANVLRLIHRRFRRGVQNVSAKYSAGFVMGNSYRLLQIESAVLIIAGAEWNRRDSFGFNSKNDAAEHSTVAVYSQEGIPQKAREILDRFDATVAA